MELLIPGLILVALMVWASTKIKRRAADAFRQEHIEGDGFILEKPDGFLSRVSVADGLLFDAYSKEFGGGAAADTRAATAVVFSMDLPVSEAASLEQSRLTTSDRSEQFELGGHKCVIVTGETEREGNSYVVSEKFLGLDGRTLALKVEVLKEQSADFARKTELILISFSPI